MVFAELIFGGDSLAVHAQTALHYGQVLAEAFQDGFQSRLEDIDYTSPDNLKRAMFDANLYRFSAASTFKEALLLKALAKEHGTFSSFKAAAEKQFNINANYLKTEYTYTKLASQGAANFLRFQDPDFAQEFDLKYQTAGDGRVRSEHKRLDGIIAPVNSPIWQRIAAPNGWNCRCKLVPVAKAYDAATRRRNKLRAQAAYEVDIPEQFALNHATEQGIFKNTHAYFNTFQEGSLNAKAYGLDKLKPGSISSQPEGGSPSSKSPLHHQVKLPGENTVASSLIEAPQEIWLNTKGKGYEYHYLRNNGGQLEVATVSTNGNALQVRNIRNATNADRKGVLVFKAA